MRARRFTMLCAALMMLGGVAHAQPSADQVLSDMGFSAEPN